jgi:ring-1,2-phenylacetyl-CoA epoxidase subunit PaaC
MLLDYLLRLADSDLVLAQRLSEWVGKAPVIEEDIALTNVGLDLLGQARLWYGYAGEVEHALTGRHRSEDEFAFRRDAHAFRNLLLVEQPNGSFAETIARQFYFDQAHLLLLDALTRSTDPKIAAIAAKSCKEVRYHAERSADWVIRLGDGTEESHRRMQAAIDELWMYTGEMFAPDALEQALAASELVVDSSTLRPAWDARVDAVLGAATLQRPAGTFMLGTRSPGGRQGVHTEHLGHLLAEMQFLQRAYPDARW